MSRALPDAPLESLLSALIDYRGKTPRKSSSGVKLITAKVIKGGRIEDGNHEFIAEADYNAWMRRGMPQQRDILITTEAPLGEVAMLRTAEKVALAQRVILLRANGTLAGQDYLFQALKSPLVQSRLYARGTGTTVLGIKQSELRQVEIPLPPLATQRRIASILSAYDDLIENNTRRIAILEEMARRIYEEWFVRFRFPGHESVRIVESELGLVPEGWSVQGLYDVADLTYGFPFKSSLFKEGGEGLGVIRIRDIRDDYTATRTTEDVDLKYRVADGDILVGMDGAFHMGRWAGGVAWLNQRVVRFRPKGGIPRSWLFWVTEEPIKILEATIVGTTVAHLSARDLKEMRVLVPSNAVLEAAGSVLEPMSDLELTLKKKNAVLRVTRDLLLPKLISGELDVSAMPEPETVAA